MARRLAVVFAAPDGSEVTIEVVVETVEDALAVVIVVEEEVFWQPITQAAAGAMQSKRSVPALPAAVMHACSAARQPQAEVAPIQPKNWEAQKAWLASGAASQASC